MNPARSTDEAYAVRFNTLPADLLDQRHTVEHWVDPDTGWSSANR